MTLFGNLLMDNIIDHACNILAKNDQSVNLLHIYLKFLK